MASARASRRAAAAGFSGQQRDLELAVRGLDRLRLERLAGGDLARPLAAMRRKTGDLVARAPRPARLRSARRAPAGRSPRRRRRRRCRWRGRSRPRRSRAPRRPPRSSLVRDPAAAEVHPAQEGDVAGHRPRLWGGHLPARMRGGHRLHAASPGPAGPRGRRRRRSPRPGLEIPAGLALPSTAGRRRRPRAAATGRPRRLRLPADRASRASPRPPAGTTSPAPAAARRRAAPSATASPSSTRLGASVVGISAQSAGRAGRVRRRASTSPSPCSATPA